MFARVPLAPGEHQLNLSLAKQGRRRVLLSGAVSLKSNVALVGPSFAGVASQAVERVPRLTAEECLKQSILKPNVFVVEGFPANQMPPNLGKS